CIMRIGFHQNDLPCRPDAVAKHQSNHTLMGADVKCPRPWSESMSAQNSDFRELGPVVVVPCRGQCVCQLDTEHDIAEAVLDHATGKCRNLPGELSPLQPAPDRRGNDCPCNSLEHRSNLRMEARNAGQDELKLGEVPGCRKLLCLFPRAPGKGQSVG